MNMLKRRRDDDIGKGHPCAIWAGLFALTAAAIIAIPVAALRFLG